METFLEILRYAIVLTLGLSLFPLVMLGWRRRNPAIFALVIFAVTGTLGTVEELGDPFPGLQLPARIIGVGLIYWWLWRERHDPAIVKYDLIDRWDGKERRHTPV